MIKFLFDMNKDEQQLPSFSVAPNVGSIASDMGEEEGLATNTAAHQHFSSRGPNAVHMLRHVSSFSNTAS